jgi:ABC-type sulfate transport system permease component
VDALPGALIAVSYLSATYAVRVVENAIRSLNLELENAARDPRDRALQGIDLYSIVQSK